MYRFCNDVVHPSIEVLGLVLAQSITRAPNDENVAAELSHDTGHFDTGCEWHLAVVSTAASSDSLVEEHNVVVFCTWAPFETRP